MRRMHTKKEIEEAAGGFDPADIPEGDILQNAVLGLNADGEAVKGSLFGKYVRIIDATEIKPNEISDEILAQLQEGVFVKGNLDITDGASTNTFKNPLFFPLQDPGGNSYAGLCISRTFGNLEVVGSLRVYTVDKTSKKLTMQGASITATDGGFYLRLSAARIYINAEQRLYIRGKLFPEYPVSQNLKTFHFLLANGELVWRQSNGLYLHTVVFDVGSDTMTFRFLTDSQDILTLDQQSGNYVFSNATFMQPVNHGNFIFTSFNANGFNPDVWSLNVSTGVFENDITLDSIGSDTVTPIG